MQLYQEYFEKKINQRDVIVQKHLKDLFLRQIAKLISLLQIFQEFLKFLLYLHKLLGTVQKNMDIAGARAATLRQNRAIASAANYNRAMAETGLRRQSDAMSVNISRGTNAALDRLATRSLGAGISHTSGTYKRLKNLIDEQGKDALVTLAQNTSSKKKEILQTQANAPPPEIAGLGLAFIEPEAAPPLLIKSA